MGLTLKRQNEGLESYYFMIFVGVIDVVGCLPQYSVPVNFGSRRNLNKNTVFHLKRLSANYH